MKGYKATNADMSCLGFQYELDKEFVYYGEIEMCKNGFHFCWKLEHVFRFYNHSNIRIFEVEIPDDAVVINDDAWVKSVTNKIKLVKEITDELPINELCASKVSNCRCWCAKKRYGLDILVHDADLMVRREVAEQGYGLDILVHDQSWDVRREVAEQGYGLDVLVNDPNGSVRCEVAAHGYGLDILINDPDWIVRFEVARQGYGQDVLVNDQNMYVRHIAENI